MKKIFITISIFIGIVSNIFAQKIDFSAFLAPGGGVHSSVSSAVDKNGNIFVAGGTREGLKVTDDAFLKNYMGHTKDDVTGGDIFLMKLSPSGELIYSTYIGGSESEYYCLQISLDNSGNVYVGFTTDSKDLKISNNAFQKSIKGENDHYIIKFTNDCRFVAATYLGGSGSDHWTRLAVNNNTLYLFGKTRSQDFPTTRNAIQSSYDNSAPPDSTKWWLSGDITITALSLNLDRILYSTYLGGKSLDYILSCSFDVNGKIILTGGTYSDNFPTTKNAFKKSMAGEMDGFLTIINRKLTRIYYSTFIGGDSTDQINSVLVQNSKNLILTGETKSPDFPVTSDALYGKYIGGRSDGFIMKFNLASNKPLYSSFIGGSKSDYLYSIVLTDKKDYVLVGSSSSKDFPVTKDAVFPVINGGRDIILIKMDKTLKCIEYSTFGGGSKQIIMSPSSCYIKGDKLLISSNCISPDFPVTLKYAEPDSTWTNCLWKFDLNGK